MVAMYTGSCKCGALQIELQGEPEFQVSISSLSTSVRISLLLKGSLSLCELSKNDWVYVFNKCGLLQVRVHYCVRKAQSVPGQGR